MMAMTPANTTTSVTIVTDRIMAINLDLVIISKFSATIITSFPTTMTFTKSHKTLVTDGAKPTNHPANHRINNNDMMTIITTLTIIATYKYDNVRKSSIVSGEVVSQNR